MDVAEIDVKTIVREVIRRLREEASISDTVAGTQGVAPSLEIADRVVTLATLEGKLTGVQTFVVPPRAIITPAARDELKQRKIAILRGETTNATDVARPKAAGGLTVGVAASGVCEAELRGMLSQSTDVVKLSRSDTAANVSALADLVLAGGSGVLITSTPATAVMLANRTSGVRAAYGFSFPAIRRAKEEIDANMLIVEPSGRSLAELAGMIADFVRK